MPFIVLPFSTQFLKAPFDSPLFMLTSGNGKLPIADLSSVENDSRAFLPHLIFVLSAVESLSTFPMNTLRMVSSCRALL